MQKLLKEPLIHFLLIGGFLFLLYGFLNPSEDEVENNVILLDNSDRERLIKGYQQNWSTAPDSTILTKLLQEEVKAEVLYREALRMNLDHNDEIIRRRLKQKYEFLVKDLADNQSPNTNELKQFYEEHSDRYLAPAKLSFTQIYFSPDKRDQPLQDANNMFEKISNSPIEKVDAKKLGDSFHLQNYFADRDQDDVRQLFGQDFAKALFDQVSEGWLSPIRSGYGIHLVYVANVKQEQSQPFDSVKESVLADWKVAQQNFYNDRLYQSLLKNYEVVYDFEK